MTYFFLKNFVLGPVLRLLFRPWSRGTEHIPKNGGAILASNHLSFVDSIFLPLKLRRPVTFLAKSEYFNGKGLRGALIKWFFISTGQIPIDRSGGKASDTGLGVLERGLLLGIYPEGTRSPNSDMHRGRTGIARMALEAGVPVIPVAMIDTDKVQPLGAKYPKIHRVGVVIGEPLDFSRFAGMEGERAVLRSVTDQIVYNIHRLSNQKYEDVYASTVKSRLARAE
jgi:1-acyl-sn-glycerol-3-phosphate acyltransferase